MGYIRRADLATVFDRIRQDALSATATPSCSVLLLSAITVDALCALKILMAVLQSEFIQFKVEPVCGYDDIAAIGKVLFHRDIVSNTVRSVVLIGCGGCADLPTFLRLPTKCAVYVLDGQRPLSLDNLFNNSQLFYIDDGFVAEKEPELKEAFEGSLIDGGDDDDDDDEFSDPDSEAGRTGLASGPYQKRRKFREYHQTAHKFGTPISRLAFELADQLNKTNNTFLWCAIVGTVSQYLVDQLSRKQWEEHVRHFQRQLSRFNRSSGQNGIKYEEEFRFMLCRHWNIHDSMLHSRYIAARLQLWRDRGWRRLTELLASMGIPLESCRRDWFVMDKQHRDDFSGNLKRYSTRFGLTEVTFPSFVKDYGYDMASGVTAGDACHALSAILEAPVSLSEKLPIADRQELVRSNFAFALQSLDQKGIVELKEGIRQAITQQQVLFRQLTAIFTHRLLRYGRQYRYAVMRGVTEHAWFHHPASLLRLALFLADSQSSTRKAHLPLLLAAHQPSTDTFLVVAVPGTHRVGTPFGHSYRAAAEVCRARIRHDAFDATVIEVAADDLKPFLQSLQRN